VEILLADLAVKISLDYIFKLTSGNESLHETSKDNGDRAATLLNLEFNS
jgi:hypothetical protein